jgi:hypothetical protein
VQRIIQNHKVNKKQLTDAIHDKPDATKYYKLHLLYYDGVPDTYDRTGNKIKGVEPDPIKAIGFLKLAYDHSRNGQLLLKLARIYQNGMYKLAADPEKGRDIYYDVMTNHPELYQRALDGYNDSQNEIKDIAVYGWLNIKRDKKKNDHEDRITRMLQKHTTGTTLFRGTANRPTVTEANFFRAHGGNEGIAGIAGIEVDPDAHNANDAHNTHNSQVVATVGLSLKKLRDEIGSMLTPAAKSLHDIRKYINNLHNCDKKEDALKTLDTIERNIIPISGVGMTETDALNLVWNRINSDKHAENKDNIKEMLYDRLADAQEHGHSVCATGRLERIVDSLNTFDDAVAIKPTYIIVQEMMDKAAKVRTDFFQNYENINGPDARKHIESGTAVDQDIVDQNTKEAITQTLRRDYVDTEIMTDAKFQTEVNKWINDI